jgi:hypothetical protein
VKYQASFKCWQYLTTGSNRVIGLRGSNNAFERPVKRLTSARGQRAIHFAQSARLAALRPAAQRER